MTRQLQAEEEEKEGVVVVGGGGCQEDALKTQWRAVHRR